MESRRLQRYGLTRSFDTSTLSEILSDNKHDFSSPFSRLTPSFLTHWLTKVQHRVALKPLGKAYARVKLSLYDGIHSRTRCPPSFMR